MIHRPRSGSRPAGLIARDHSPATARLILGSTPLRAAAAPPIDRATAADTLGAERSPERPVPGSAGTRSRDGVIDWLADRRH